VAIQPPELFVYNLLTSTSGSIYATINTRLFPNFAPQDAALPYVVYTRDNTEHYHHLEGVSGLMKPSIQLNIYTDKYKVVKTLAEQIRVIMENWGNMGLHYIGASSGGNTVTIKHLSLDSEQDDFIGPISAKGTGTHMVVQDYIFAVNETVV